MSSVSRTENGCGQCTNSNASWRGMNGLQVLRRFAISSIHILFTRLAEFNGRAGNAMEVPWLGILCKGKHWENAADHPDVIFLQNCAHQKHRALIRQEKMNSPDALRRCGEGHLRHWSFGACWRSMEPRHMVPTLGQNHPFIQSIVAQEYQVLIWNQLQQFLKFHATSSGRVPELSSVTNNYKHVHIHELVSPVSGVNMNGNDSSDEFA